MPEMEKSAPVGVVGRLLRLDPLAAGAGLPAPRLMPSPREVNDDDDRLPSYLGWPGNVSEGPRIKPTTGQVTLHGRGWERYLGLPIRQRNGTCVFVSCIVCLEAKHRFEYETVHGEGTFFIPRTRRADEPLRKLFDECRADGIWVKGRGANVGKVLDKIRAMGRLEAANAPPTPAPCCILPLRSWQSHSWDDYFGTGLSPRRVAALLARHGPCVGVLWVEPPYFDVDAGCDDTDVYRGYGRSKDYREQSKRLHGDKAGSHAVVCFAYRRFHGDEMHVLVMDNHDDATGPLRWIAVEAFEALYTLSVERLDLPSVRHDDDDLMTMMIAAAGEGATGAGGPTPDLPRLFDPRVKDCFVGHIVCEESK